MIIENKSAIKLVEILKESTKLDQKATAVAFSEKGSRCSITLVWKSKKMKSLTCTDASTDAMLANMIAWTLGGSI